MAAAVQTCVTEVQSGRFTPSSTKNFLDARPMPNMRKQTRSSLALPLDQDVVHNVDQATAYRPDTGQLNRCCLYLLSRVLYPVFACFNVSSRPSIQERARV